jgi:hypothetical protein
MKFDVSMTFDIPAGAVTPNQLQRAILRAVKTREFMYKGSCTVNFVESVLEAMLAQAREHADNAVASAPKTHGMALSADGKFVDVFNPPSHIIELKEANRLLADVLEKLIKDGVG